MTAELLYVLDVLSGTAQPRSKLILKNKISYNLDDGVTNRSAKGMLRYITLLIKETNHCCGEGLLGHITVFY